MTVDTKKLFELANAAAAALLAIYEHRRRHSPTTEWNSRRTELDNYFIDAADPVLGQMRDVIDELENNTCARHADQKHGAEAEELRRGIERIAAATLYPELQRELQALLDEVDARDSLEYLEARDAKLEAAKRRGDDLAKVGIDLVSLVDTLADTLRKATTEYESKIGKLWESV